MATHEMAIVPTFRVGSVISASFSIWMKNLVFFSLLGIASNVPATILEHALAKSSAPSNEPAGFWSNITDSLPVMLCNMVFGQIVIAVMTYGVVQQLRGRRVEIGACLNAGLRRALPVVGTSLLAGLLTSLAMLALLIPGLILSMMFWVAIPACVAEGVGSLESLRRSAALTKGYRWQILGIVLLIAAISYVAVLVVSFAGTVSMVQLAQGNAGLTAAILLLVMTGLISTFSSICAATGYYYLRVAKEGVDIDQIASVFD